MNKKQCGFTPMIDWLNRRRNVLAPALLSVGWFFFAYPAVFSPWIQGIDSIIRLANIDKTIVVVLGNPWLPMLQLLMQGVNLICDCPVAYKLAAALCALAGMWFFFQVINLLLGFWAAVFSYIYFFVHIQWLGVATSVYMEPLFMLFCSAAGYCCIRRRCAPASFFLIAATFSRPEALIAAPSLLLVHWCLKHDLRSTLRVALLFLPIACYYLILKLVYADFTWPGQLNWEISLSLVRKTVAPISRSDGFKIALPLAMLGLCALLLDRQFLAQRRRALLISLAGLVLFLAIFIFILPLLHAFSTGGTRHSIFLGLPIFVLASLSLQYLYQIRPKVLGPCFTLLVPVILLTQYRPYLNAPPATWHNAKTVLSSLNQAADGSDPRSIQVCELDPRYLTGHDVNPLYKQAIVLYLRFSGWRANTLICDMDKLQSGMISGSRSSLLLRIYDVKSLTPEYLAALTADCRQHGKLLRRSWGKLRIYASFCL